MQSETIKMCLINFENRMVQLSILIVKIGGCRQMG